ncbi:MAG: toprim domain-containing protein [Alphaproteobacteria bacterium]|nr:toprim domain-containing protein [Alphaproteobacteria bacterium]
MSVIAPATLRYLPAYKDYPHAVIAACGAATETEPGELQTPERVAAVHLTELSLDGLTKLGKRMLGPVSGHPIVLAPPGDGLGLVLAEGIEDALSVHQATGLGAWAAGSAAHMTKLGLVVPSYIETVTLIEDDDRPGRKACDQLQAVLIERDIEVRRVRCGGGAHGARS